MRRVEWGSKTGMDPFTCQVSDVSFMRQMQCGTRHVWQPDKEVRCLFTFYPEFILASSWSISSGAAVDFIGPFRSSLSNKIHVLYIFIVKRSQQTVIFLLHLHRELGMCLYCHGFFFSPPSNMHTPIGNIIMQGRHASVIMMCNYAKIWLLQLCGRRDL